MTCFVRKALYSSAYPRRAPCFVQASNTASSIRVLHGRLVSACLEMRNTLRSSSPLISCAAATGNAGPFNRVLSDCSPSPARGGNVSWLFVWLLYGHVIRLCNTAWKATASQLFCEAWCTSHVLRVSRILQMNMRDDKPSRCWSCKCYKMRDISFISMVRPL